MKILVEGLKQVPNNQQYLSLNLRSNYLGYNVNYMKFLLEGMKQLPNCLKELDLYLSQNKLE